MVIYSNAAAQTLQPGQALTLTKISGCTCNSAVNPVPGAKVTGKCVHVVSFTGNVSSATASAPVELSIAIDGVAVPTSRMVSTPSTANVFNSVSAVTGFSGNNCCLGTDITVVNTGTNPVTVAANAGLVIWRE